MIDREETKYRTEVAMEIMKYVHVYYCVRGMHYGVTPFHVMKCHMGCNE